MPCCRLTAKFSHSGLTDAWRGGYRSLFRTAAAKKDPNKIHSILALRGEKPSGKYSKASTRGSQPSAENILRQYAAENKDKIWEPKPFQNKFGPAELGDRQEDTAGR